MKLSQLLLTSLAGAAAIPLSSALTEPQILEHLYHNLNGDSWTNPWDLTSTSICTDYHGVVCKNSRIAEIDLSDNNLQGSITPHLYSLEYLEKVDFSKNGIVNAGWDRISDLPNFSSNKVAPLKVIDLGANKIHSLDGISLLKDTLTGLHMTYNNIKEWQDDLFTLKNLQVLAVSENGIGGKMDERIGQLVGLKEFYCYGNELTGTLPTEIGALTKLQILTFAENHLTGPLPSTLSNLSNLRTFSVHNNDVDTGHSGPLPSFNSHPFLDEIYLDGNFFTGEIPSDFLEMLNETEVITLGLSNNLLTGEVPDEFSRFTSLNLNVVGNNITGLGSEIACSGSWMNGLVERFGCDAILCPVGFYAEEGRQEEDEVPCMECAAGTGGFMGARSCDSVEVDVNEMEILAEFYLACLGPQWDSAEGWSVMADIESPEDMTLPSFLKVDHCQFEGVTCEDGKVVAVQLPSNGLEGMIPSSFWDLPGLKEVDLSGNELTLARDYGFGDIGNAKSLVKLDLSSNDIQKWTGIGRAKSLQELYLDDAYFFGAINPALYALSNLKVLHMQYSGLKGKIPEGLSKLTNLNALNLYGNELTGNIPTEIGLMTKLWHVDFSENDFTGHLPADISKLTHLEKFHVSQSSRQKDGITGKLPAFKNNIKLHMLDLSSNSMTGSIPSDFLGGVEDTDQVMEIKIGYNDFVGTVPASLSRFSNMTLDAVKTQLTKVPTALCSLTDWMHGEVGEVIASGGNGCDAILCPVGTYNDYGRATSGSNGECKSCSGGKYVGQTTCSGVSSDDANMEKKILDKLFVQTAGPDWGKGENWANGGAICTYEGITCSQNGTNVNKGVVGIDLTGFGLIGKIPTDIYKLPQLKHVDFSSNVVDLSFVGIEQSSTLESITISDADLTSVLGIGNAPSSLKKLHIQRNSFPPGDIPAELYTASSLESISIGFNGFEGSISSDISKLANLQEFWAGGNHLTGSIPNELTQLSSLLSINLSGNRMSGAIPNELEDIETLRYLNLAGQRDFGGFSGPVPSFDTSPHLHEIDLSRNSLTGTVPTDFLLAVRTSTSHADYSGVQIDLSSNKITGAIPSEFDDFASLFLNLAGNKISSVPSTICDDDDEFQNGLVGQLTDNKCDAVLCPKGTFSAVGRQTDVSVPCEACQGGVDEAPYFGSMKCESVSGERKTLQHLYELIFTESSERDYWGSENPICSWYGITCSGGDTEEEGVTEINLEDNSLASDNMAEVSELFFDLPSLKVLNIRGNDLQLKLDSLSHATNLEVLQVSATGLKSISGISAASNLKELHVTENDLKGPFPAELLQLPLLEKLFISFNEITGTLPNEIGTSLSNLKEFFAFTNNMNGTIPTALGNLVQLERLVLGQNEFEGTLPTQLNNLINLKELSFYHENSEGALNGKIPTLAKLTHLESLDLEGNKFTGSIPSAFLSGLDADYIASKDNEVILHLADNAFTGTLPEALSRIENLFIDIAGNNFKGPIPSSFCEKESWMEGKVGEVMSCDAIACPANTYNPSGRGYDDRQDDSHQQCLPCGGLQAAPFLGSYSCVHQHLESSTLKALYHDTGGDSWSDRTNWLDDSKPICSWHGVKCKGGSVDNSTVTEIDLGDNNLVGTMPGGIWELPYLTKLNLKENGGLHIGFDNIKKAKQLETLYISDVDIGHINGIGGAPALKELHLTSNELTGTFPDELFNLASTLEQLFMAYNSFSGPLSTKFGRFTKLTDFYAYGNDFTGPIPEEMGTLNKLQNFVVAENMLSGTIPSGFSNMASLKLFSAYRRLKNGPTLTGPLPSFANCPQLQGLYLDYNQLSGAIPQDFLASSLSTKLITISHNALTGTVPLSLDSIEGLNIEMEGNKIAGLSDKFCDNNAWMNNAVTFFDCDAIMCPPHTFSIYGRQNSTGSACQDCDKGTESTPYWGSLSCDVEIKERDILELLYNKCDGKNWYRQDNWMSSEDICSWYGIECKGTKSVQAIRLGANNLAGTPPKEIFELKQLHTLWLHSNPIDFKFTGIDKAENLVELRLDSTGLTDLYGLEGSKSLVKLNLKYNSISGSFPEAILQLSNLEELDLTDNMFTGELPHSFGKAINLVSIKLGSNDFSGSLRGFSVMEFLRHVDLSDNKLSGTIPADFLESVSTRKPLNVDLSSNKLSGRVPTDLDRFDNLAIYLRDNQFTELPPTLCDLNNRGWNLRDVELFGCDAIMCPPGTANYHGRQSAEHTRCERCSSNTNLYGQVTCDGVRLSSPGASRYLAVGAMIVSFVAAAAALIL